MRTHWSCLITEVSKLITHSWCSLDSNMGLYYTEDGSYRMVHLHYMPPNDKLNSRDLTTILFSVYVRWVQPLSATWFRLQVDRLGLTDERGSRPCFYARQLQLVCVRPSVSCSLRCLHVHLMENASCSQPWPNEDASQLHTCIWMNGLWSGQTQFVCPKSL